MKNKTTDKMTDMMTDKMTEDEDLNDNMPKLNLTMEIAEENFGEVDEEINNLPDLDPNNAVSFKPKFAMFVIASFAYFAMI